MSNKSKLQINDLIEEIEKYCVQNSELISDKDKDGNTIPGKCMINNPSDNDYYLEKCNQLRQYCWEISSDIFKFYQNSGIEIPNLLDFSNPEVCKNFEIHVFNKVLTSINETIEADSDYKKALEKAGEKDEDRKKVEETFKKKYEKEDPLIYTINSFMKDPIIENNLNYYLRKNDSSLTTEMANKENLKSVIYGEKVLTKEKVCQNISQKFVKILNIIGCILALLLEENKLFEGNIYPKERLRVTNLDTEPDQLPEHRKPFFYKKIRSLMNKELNKKYKIPICQKVKDKDTFEYIFDGKSSEGKDIKLDSLLPIQLLTTLIKLNNKEPKDIEDYTKIIQKYSKKQKGGKPDEDVKTEEEDIELKDNYQDFLTQLDVIMREGNKSDGSHYSGTEMVAKTEKFTKNCAEGEDLIINDNSEQDKPDENFNFLVEKYNKLRGLYLGEIINFVKYLFGEKDKVQETNLFLYCFEGKDETQCKKETGDDPSYLFDSVEELKKFTIKLIDVSDGKGNYGISLTKDEKVIEIKESLISDISFWPTVKKEDVLSAEFEITDVKKSDLVEESEKEFSSDTIDSPRIKLFLKHKASKSVSDGIGIGSFINDKKEGMWKINFSIPDDNLNKIMEEVQSKLLTFFYQFEENYSGILQLIGKMYVSENISFGEIPIVLSGKTTEFTSILKFNKNFFTRETKKQDLEKIVLKIKDQNIHHFLLNEKQIKDIIDINPGGTIEEAVKNLTGEDEKKLEFKSSLINLESEQENMLSNGGTIQSYNESFDQFLKENFDNGVELDYNNEITVSPLTIEERKIILDSVTEYCKGNGGEEEANTAREKARGKANEKNSKNVDEIGQNVYKQCLSSEPIPTECDNDIIKECHNEINRFENLPEEDKKIETNQPWKNENVQKWLDTLTVCRQNGENITIDDEELNIDELIKKLSPETQTISTTSQPVNETDTYKEQCIQTFCGEGEKDWKGDKCFTKSLIKYHPDKTGCQTSGTEKFKAVEGCSDGKACTDEQRKIANECDNLKSQWEELQNCKEKFAEGDVSDKEGDSGENLEIASQPLAIGPSKEVTLNFPIDLPELSEEEKGKIEKIVTDIATSQDESKGSTIEAHFRKGGYKKTRKNKKIKKKTNKQRGGGESIIDVTFSNLTPQQVPQIEHIKPTLEDSIKAEEEKIRTTKRKQEEEKKKLDEAQKEKTLEIEAQKQYKDSKEEADKCICDCEDKCVKRILLSINLNNDKWESWQEADKQKYLRISLSKIFNISKDSIYSYKSNKEEGNSDAKYQYTLKYVSDDKITEINGKLSPSLKDEFNKQLIKIKEKDSGFNDGKDWREGDELILSIENLVQGGKKRTSNKRILRKKSKKNKFGGSHNSNYPFKNDSMTLGIRSDVNKSLDNVVKCNKPIYYGSQNHPFNTAVNVAKRLDPDNSNWSKWKFNNIGGKKNKITKKKKLNRKRSLKR